MSIRYTSSDALSPPMPQVSPAVKLVACSGSSERAPKARASTVSTGAVRTSTYSGTPVTALLRVRLLVELKYCWANAGAWKPLLTEARNATPPSS